MIAVLGANGMAGHAITRYLLSADHKVTTVARNNADIITDFEVKSDIDKLVEILQSSNIKFVVNCIGLLVQDSFNRPDRAIILNGGNFELWDDTRTKQKTLVAHQNRLVVMETNKTSWHSVSKVTADRPRCCVSNYYFSEISPDGDKYFHVTSFSGRPEQPVRRLVGVVDNALRNIISKTLKAGRGKNLINKDK